MIKIKQLYTAFLNKLLNSWRSWTILINSFFAIILLELPDLQSSFPQLQGYIPDTYYKYAMALIIVTNIILRFKTIQDLANKGK